MGAWFVGETWSGLRGVLVKGVRCFVFMDPRVREDDKLRLLI